jgi:hypothetical protein
MDLSQKANDNVSYVLCTSELGDSEMPALSLRKYWVMDCRTGDRESDSVVQREW